jgi:O-antigen/teichoic acid export membrane protein
MRGFLRADAGRATLLAVLTTVAGLIALGATVAFSHVLDEDYGALVALFSAFFILAVPGQALQTTVARDVSRAVAAGEPDPLGAVWVWLRGLAVVVLGLAVASLAVTGLSPGRSPIAAAIGVEQEWAAATILPAAAIWLMLSVERGALQGMRRYGLVGGTMVGEHVARLVLGLGLYAAGLGVTGAFVGTTGAVVVMTAALAPVLSGHHVAGRAQVDGLRALLGRAPAALGALALFAVLQNVDVIVVQHMATDAVSSAYAAAAVAAKAVIFVATGLGLFLLPEAVRRTHAGNDARPVLAGSLLLIAVVAAPMVALYAVAGDTFLLHVFGADRVSAAPALPWLGVAMTLLACAYLGMQYMLALHDNRFLWLLGTAAVAQPLLMLAVGPHLTSLALALVVLLGVLAAAVLWLSFRDAGRRLAMGAAAPRPRHPAVAPPAHDARALR